MNWVALRRIGMATVTIPEPTYRRLQAIAAAMHLPLDQFLHRVAFDSAETSGNGRPAAKPGTDEWINAFNAWVASHPARPYTADDSRDAIYGDERD
jgi:hypothetical protein